MGNYFSGLKHDNVSDGNIDNIVFRSGSDFLDSAIYGWFVFGKPILDFTSVFLSLGSGIFVPLI